MARKHVREYVLVSTQVWVLQVALVVPAADHHCIVVLMSLVLEDHPCLLQWKLQEMQGQEATVQVVPVVLVVPAVAHHRVVETEVLEVVHHHVEEMVEDPVVEAPEADHPYRPRWPMVATNHQHHHFHQVVEKENLTHL